MDFSEWQKQPVEEVHCPVLPLDGWLATLWHLLNIVSVSYLFFLISIFVFFPEGEQLSPGAVGVHWLLLAVFAVDVLLQFNLAREVGGLVVEERALIRKDYLQFGLWADLCVLVVSVLSFSQVLKGPAKFLFLLGYLKVHQLLRCDRAITQNSRSPLLVAAYKLARVLYIELLICNLAGSLFYFLDAELHRRSVFPESDLWLYSSSALANISALPVRQQFVYALYWSVTTTCGIGYGDIIPLNPAENLYTVFVEFLSIFFFAYVVTTFWEVLAEYRLQVGDTSAAFQDSLLKISPLTSDQTFLTKTAFQLSSHQQHSESFQTDIFKKLSPSLRQELALFLYSQFLSVLRPSFNKLIANCCTLVQESVLINESRLSLYPDRLFYLYEGHLDLVLTCGPFLRAVKKHTARRHYLFRQFFLHARPRNYDFVTGQFVRTFYIERNDLQQFLQDNNALKADYARFVQRVRFDPSFPTLYCQICDVYQHNLQNCPLLVARLAPNQCKLPYANARQHKPRAPLRTGRVRVEAKIESSQQQTNFDLSLERLQFQRWSGKGPVLGQAQ